MSRVFSVGDWLYLRPKTPETFGPSPLAQRSFILRNTPNGLPIADASANYDFLTIRCRWAGCIFMQSVERTIR